jgi:hypothetical protein
MRKLNPGILIAALGAVALLVSLFLEWFEPDLTAWTVFEAWDLVLALLAIVTIVLAAAELGWWRGPVPGVRLVVLAGVALVLVAGALLNHPPAGVGRETHSGIWIALGGALAMAVGAALSEARISLTLNVDRRERATGADRHAAGAPGEDVTRVMPDPGAGRPPAG